MKRNKKEFESFARSFSTRHCRKLPMDNIILPSFKANRMIGMMFRQVLITKELPAGCLYDEDTYQVVCRVINGKLLINGMLDVYTWKQTKVAQMEKRPIGFIEGEENLKAMLATMPNAEERDMLKDFFALFTFDMSLVHTEAEERKCIEVTQELYDSGLNYSVDEWMPEDENGEAEATKLNVGDFLIVSDDGVYCIRHDEFIATHTFV